MLVLAPKPLWGLPGMDKEMNQLPTRAIWNSPDKYIIPGQKGARSPSVIETE